VADEDYHAWARAFHGRAFLRRSAERNAAFLLPRLEPGQRLVDVGCGPGAITAGLAERVAPGPVVGIDRDASYVAAARQRWDRPNLRFEEGDAVALPLDDGAVDVAFLHAVLQHVDSPIEVLREVRRVVRPGGVVAVADADMDGYLVHPCTDDLRRGLDLDRRTRRNPEVGRQLPALLVEAGFAEVDYGVVANVAAADGAAAVAESAAARHEAPPFVAHVTAQGWATPAELERIAAAWRWWGQAPGAVFVTLWCQAVAT